VTSRPSALCAGVTIDAFGCVITLGLLIWPQMLVEGGGRVPLAPCASTAQDLMSEDERAKGLDRHPRLQRRGTAARDARFSPGTDIRGLQVVISDNTSTDATPKIAERMQSVEAGAATSAPITASL
jgi:hypothetical protein